MELLERTPFLQTLAEYAGEARQGNGRLVLISGESGMGKTVLLEAFQRRIRGARWLWGACDGLLTPRPLGPLFDIGSWLDGELADLCRQRAPREQLFTAFLAEIDSPATLTVTVMEDVHWADEATIDLLSFLGRRLGRMSTLLLVTYRDDELSDDHPLRVVLGALEWVFTKMPKTTPLKDATFGSFPAACHYADGTFIPDENSKTCPKKAPHTGAKFTFWHPDLITMHVWVWYPNPAGLYSSTNPLAAPFNHG